MPVGHGPFGFSEAEVRAELDRRRALHHKRLKAAQERLTKLRSENAVMTQELFLLQAQLDEVNTEQEALMAEAAAAAHQRGDLATALADQYREEAALDYQALAAAKQRLYQYRMLRAQLITGVLALILPFLRERSRKEEARNV